MGGDGTKGSLWRFGRRKILTEAQLLHRGWWDPPFAFLAEELAAEPVQLLLEALEFRFEFLLDRGIEHHLQMPSSEGFGIGSGDLDFCRF